MGVIAAACGVPGSPAARPASPATSRPASPATSPAALQGRYSLIMPPFGRNARVVMTPWLPASTSQAQAVITAKNMLLAILYADYTGGRDHRWQAFAGSPQVRSGMALILALPQVTSESWTGTIRIWHMTAAAGPRGTISVTECLDTSGTRNTSLRTGKVLPPAQQLQDGQNYYSLTYVMARNTAGQWAVISIPPAIPGPSQCRP